jgi:hypothetical protein
MFFSDRLVSAFQGERDEALLSVATIGHVFCSMPKTEAENDMENRVFND